jgi:hypothetical protein
MAEARRLGASPEAIAQVQAEALALPQELVDQILTKETWWLSCHAFTCRVITHDDTITDPAPIIKRFQGQDLSNLLRWIERKFGSYELEKLN